MKWDTIINWHLTEMLLETSQQPNKWVLYQGPNLAKRWHFARQFLGKKQRERADGSDVMWRRIQACFQEEQLKKFKLTEDFGLVLDIS